MSPTIPTPDVLVKAAELATSSALTKLEQDNDMTAKKISETAEDVLVMAREFLQKTSPSVLTVLDAHSDKKSSEDRLIKIGRNVFGSVLRYGKDGTNADQTKLEAAMKLLVEESNQLGGILEGKTTKKVPTVRFGKTELQMPIVTLGCMRFQQSWNRGKKEDVVLDMSKVEDECQENLVNILRYAYQCGVTHIETAKGYGSSQLQLGFALKQLFDSGEIKREDLIIQTKLPVAGSKTPAAFRDAILASIRLLQLDYIDLFAVHGLNMQSDYDALFNNPEGNLCEALTELKQKGKIRSGIGFSTHAPAKLIQKAIETDFFDYINLHYQWCGSYTASGDLEDAGNLSNVRLAQKRDMGIFIISVYDKGGKLYTPSNKLRDLCLPDMEPMTYGSVWLWQHGTFDAENAAAHTFTVGAARPSDLDQPIVHSLALAEHGKDLAERRERIRTRLNQAMVDALGQEWVDTWNQGVLNAYDSKYQTHHTGLVWAYNLIKGWGMLDFAKDRYGPMERFLKTWSKDKTSEENLKKLGIGFGWMPGVAIDSSLDYTPDFANCPEENKERLMEAIHFVHEWASTPAEGQGPKKVPVEWEAAFDMRPWTAFPER